MYVYLNALIKMNLIIFHKFWILKKSQIYLHIPVVICADSNMMHLIKNFTLKYIPMLKSGYAHG